MFECADEIKNAENEFKVLQMFSIGRLLDFSDEVGRRFMISLLRDIVSVHNAPVSFVEEVMEFLFVLLPQLDERIG